MKCRRSSARWIFRAKATSSRSRSNRNRFTICNTRSTRWGSKICAKTSRRINGNNTKECRCCRKTTHNKSGNEASKGISLQTSAPPASRKCSNGCRCGAGGSSSGIYATSTRDSSGYGKISASTNLNSCWRSIFKGDFSCSKTIKRATIARRAVSRKPPNKTLDDSTAKNRAASSKYVTNFSQASIFKRIKSVYSV